MTRALPRPAHPILVPVVLQTPALRLPVTVSLLPSPATALLLPRVAIKLFHPDLFAAVDNGYYPTSFGLVRQGKRFRVGKRSIHLQDRTMKALLEGAKEGEKMATVFFSAGDCALAVNGTKGDEVWRESLVNHEKGIGAREVGEVRGDMPMG